MTSLQILQIIGFPSIMSGLVAVLISRFFMKRDNRSKEEKEQDTEFEKLKKDIAEYEELFQKYTVIIEQMSVVNEILSQSIQAIIRDRLLQAYNYYYVKKGFLPIYVRDALYNMYNQYHKLGANGVIDDYMEQLFSLPTEPPKK